MTWFGLTLLMRVMCRSIAESSRGPGEGVRCRWRRVGGECERRESSIARSAVEVA